MARAPKQPKEIEYAFYVYRRTDERTGELCTVFEIQTTKEFTSFRYELDVVESYDKEKKEFVFNIGGMSAPVSLLPGVGSAQGVHEHPDLKAGSYKIKFIKPPRQTNLFTLKLAKNEITVTRRASKSKPFINIHIGAPEQIVVQ
jgi:hypothetical protein